MGPGKIVRIRPRVITFDSKTIVSSRNDEYHTVLTRPKMILDEQGLHEILVVDVMSSSGKVINNLPITMLEEVT